MDLFHERLARIALDAAGDASVLAAAHLNLGRLHSTRGQHAEAIDAYRHATTHAQNAGWPHGQATAIGNIGTGYLGDGAVRSWEAVPGGTASVVRNLHLD